MADFQVLLSLALGVPLEALRDMPMPDFQRYWRFYLRHPWGPVWDVKLAWLSGAIGRQVYRRNPTTLDDALAALVPGTGKKRQKLEPVKDGWVKKLAAMMGAIGPDGKRVTDAS